MEKITKITIVPDTKAMKDLVKAVTKLRGHLDSFNQEVEEILRRPSAMKKKISRSVNRQKA